MATIIISSGLRSKNNLIRNNLIEMAIPYLSRIQNYGIQALNKFFKLLIGFFTVVLLTLGCNSVPPLELYENQQFGIRIEKPANWEAEYYERSGSIVLEAQSSEDDSDSARIEIFGIACVPTISESQDEHLETGIERIRNMFNLDVIEIVNEPVAYSKNDYQIIQTTVLVPESSLVEGDILDRTQTIRVFSVYDNYDNSIIVYFYEAKKDNLNIEGEKIIDSIDITC